MEWMERYRRARVSILSEHLSAGREKGEVGEPERLVAVVSGHVGR